MPDKRNFLHSKLPLLDVHSQTTCIISLKKRHKVPVMVPDCRFTIPNGHKIVSNDFNIPQSFDQFIHPVRDFRYPPNPDSILFQTQLRYQPRGVIKVVRYDDSTFRKHAKQRTPRFSVIGWSRPQSLVRGSFPVATHCLDPWDQGRCVVFRSFFWIATIELIHVAGVVTLAMSSCF